MTKTRSIAILAVPGVQLLDVAGPLDVFAEANARSGQALYRPVLLASRAGELRCSSGIRLAPDGVAGREGEARFDTLLVAGAPHAADLHPPPSLREWMRRHARGARRYGSVCSGAYLLGAAGLLDGRRVATHWAEA